VQLVPRRPQGSKATRKALGFNAEIRRLRAEGYTFEAIREALEDAGVFVSRSTVMREACRLPRAAPRSAAGGVAHDGSRATDTAPAEPRSPGRP
jgi:hypothetical protein